MGALGMKFGAYLLQDPANGIWVVKTDVASAPENKIQADQLADSDGALVVKQQYASKTFTVEGWLRAPTRALLEAKMDQFKAALSQRNQAFDVDYAGGIRRYLANAVNQIIADSGLTSAKFSVLFQSPDGVGWDINSTAFVSSVGTTVPSKNIDVVAGGSYQVEPYVRVVLNTVSGGTAKTVTISNGVSLRGISVTRTWVSGDVLEIDSQKHTIYVNNNPVEFKGQFPSWMPGAGSLSYLDDFTTRDATITSSYTKRWL